MGTVGKRFCSFAFFLLALCASGCISGPIGKGTFDRTLTVTGTVRLEVNTGSGDVIVTAGPAGQVRVHGDFEVFGTPGTRAESHIDSLSKNPPIEQLADTIRLGQDRDLLRNVRINYTVTVPEESLVQIQAGSGDVEVRGVRGPVRLESGSGDQTVEKVSGEVEARTGSGNQHFTAIGSTVRSNSSSGDIVLNDVKGEIRLDTSSGDITVARPGGRLSLEASSGDIRVTDILADVRAKTGSGNVELEGKPPQRFYWEIRTSSGDVSLGLPESASFRLEARTHSGDISTNIPLTVEEKSRRMLRARSGSGVGRITADTGSGSIRIH